MNKTTQEYKEMQKLAEELTKDEKCPVCRKHAIDKHLERMIVLHQLSFEEEALK